MLENSLPTRAREKASIGELVIDRTLPSTPEPRLSVSALADLWERVRRKLRAELGDDVVASWFGSLELAGIEGGVARLSVPTRFLKSWIDTHYAERLRKHFAADCNAVSVEVSVRGATPQRSSVTRIATRLADASAACEIASTFPRPLSRPGPDSRRDKKQQEVTMPLSVAAALDRQLTFDNFVVGRSNQFACAAARKVGETVGGQAVYNPLYIHAAVGLGKTHLAQAMAHSCESRAMRALYLTADRFMHGFVSALRSQTAIQFKDQMRNIDLLIVDDVQFLQGKTVQQEFCHIINALADQRRQMVVAADRPPGDLEGLDERIKSRLAGGLCVEIGAFDEDLRRRILERRIASASERDPSFKVPQNVIDFVASSITSNGRDLDGAVNRLLAHASFAGAHVTLESAETAIRDLIRAREPKRVRVEEILKLVSAHFNVTRADLLSSRRTASVVRPRQIAMYLSKTLTLRSLPEIGRRFGGRDHTTVLHAVRKIEGLIGENPNLKDEIALLKRMLTD
ncbi:MAG: chromosomal replication initiator protein DnaA [Hyphomicrobiales bacterium]|nr:chromosomal replication initiator protein DnaA [Hyphomicrobiales bacterium]MBV9739002.1 chromosomal replication initiator protein DnaA [Hyphomicrobiales bacterium]